MLQPRASGGPSPRTLRAAGGGGAGSASALRAVITNPAAFAEQCELAAVRSGDSDKRSVMLGALLAALRCVCVCARTARSA